MKNFILAGLTLATPIPIVIQQSANAASFTTIADSVSEFSGVQGQNNWYYGYYDGPFTSSDFKPMTQYDNSQNFWWLKKGTYWTSVWATGQHPNGNPSTGYRLPIPQWPVRRWVSEVDGEVTISGKLAAADPFDTGDGRIGHILVDGLPIWSKYIAPKDLVGVDYSLNASVKKGSFVDFAIAPNVSDWYDSTTFTTTIAAEPEITPVPEPASTVGLLALGTFGTGSVLKRKNCKECG